MNRYSNIPKLRTEKGIAYVTTRYPEIPLSNNDIYVYTSREDRFDVLSQQYYGDSSLWWIISIANPKIPQNSLIIPEGIQIRIPANQSAIVSQFKRINS
jgi:phage tail protein X|tara:strand:+ start:237 stop:533 length:297 start_codon:yes stop_codon:yes gene_type:complete